MLEFINNAIKICITAVFHMFKKLSGNLKDIKEIRHDLLEMKTIIIMKTIINYTKNYNKLRWKNSISETSEEKINKPGRGGMEIEAIGSEKKSFKK